MVIVHMTTQAPQPTAPSSNSTRRRAHAEVAEEVDVAIVGSGLGGLVTACYLAQRGLSVAVLESHYVAGGCATQFSRGPRHARYRFDVGLHYVGDCRADGTIPRILEDLGVRVDFEELDPDGFDRLVFPDLEFRIPANVERFRDRLVDAFPRERRGIDRYVRLVEAVMHLGRMLDVYEGTKPPWMELVRAAPHGLRMATIQNATIGQVLDGITSDPKLRAVLLGQSGDYGMPPSRASAVLHLGLLGHYLRGAFYPKGGGQRIADELVLRLEALGGAVHLRTPVERILVEGGRAVGVRLAGKAGAPARDVRAKLVVSNADLKRTLLDLVGPEHLPSGWVERTKRFQMGGAIFMTFVGLRGSGRDVGLTNANVWQFDDYDVERFYSSEDGARGCYVTSASMKDPEHATHHAPSDHFGLEIMTLVPTTRRYWGADCDPFSWEYKHDARYHEQKARLEDDMLARLERLYPGSRARVVLAESATPMSHSRFTGASDGTGYGLAATPEQFMKRRPGYRGPVPGLYLVGASTRAGHGIVGAMMGGRACARRVLAAARAGEALTL